MKDKCGFMVLTPTPLHDGGLWCAEDYPCKIHGEWKDNSNKSKVVYVCQACEAEISYGAIICPHCGKTDPNVRAIGVSQPPTDKE